jgi:hypothetical protein
MFESRENVKKTEKTHKEEIRILKLKNQPDTTKYVVLSSQHVSGTPDDGHIGVRNMLRQ